MKTRLLAILILLLGSLRLIAGETPGDFVEIPWGARKDSAKDVFKRRPGVSIASETPEMLQFKGGEWAGHKVSGWDLDFAADHLYQGTIYLQEADGRKLFDVVSAALKQKYGNAPVERGKNHLQIIWQFKDTPASKGDKSVALRLSTRSSIVKVSYKNQAFKPAIDKKEDNDL